MTVLLTPEELESELRRVGQERYHDRHPFHRLMVEGRLNKGQLQAWALNRYYYQASIPIKDATILSRMREVGLRRVWRQRVLDHDGDDDGQGGLDRWLALTDGLGLARSYVTSLEGLLPATRFAVDAYVWFCRDRSVLEAIASSLTELFSPTTIDERVRGLLAAHDFIKPEALAYFEPRLTQAPRDTGFALDYVRREARTPEQQQLAIHALIFKCSVLWSQLDALHFAYVDPALPPPGAFVPDSAR